jgi:hypothetical protein
MIDHQHPPPATRGLDPGKKPGRTRAKHKDIHLFHSLAIACLPRPGKLCPHCLARSVARRRPWDFGRDFLIVPLAAPQEVG